MPLMILLILSSWSMQVDTPLMPRRRMSMTPLIDVVFLLLVFFMLASTFMKYSQIDVTGSMPGRAASVVQGANYVRIHASERIDLNGENIELNRLVSVLDEAASRPNARVIVRPMEKTDVQTLIKVLEVIRSSKINQIIVAK